MEKIYREYFETVVKTANIENLKIRESNLTVGNYGEMKECNACENANTCPFKNGQLKAGICMHGVAYINKSEIEPEVKQEDKAGCLQIWTCPRCGRVHSRVLFTCPCHLTERTSGIGSSCSGINTNRNGSF